MNQLENASLGIELGSTRIKAVLINKNAEVLASGNFSWENKLKDGIWTYDLEDILNGLKSAYSDLNKNVETIFGQKLTKLKSIGISAMMHGYLVLDSNDNLIAPFKTWRNTITQSESEQLTKLFDYNIPQRWSISHLYKTILNNDTHTKHIAYMTTLSGYIHYILTGEKVLGVGDASGMFPIDQKTNSYYEDMLEKFDNAVEKPYKLKDIMPKVLVSGENAGTLTKNGALLLDESGNLECGIPFCPPEGDAGTGMVATNSIAKRTGNISAGTSIFAMIVLEENLAKVYHEIDMVTTPNGNLVAMAHANNCTSDINAWVNIFKEYGALMGFDVDINTLYENLFKVALTGDFDCGKLMSYGFYSGENMINDLNVGRPLFVRGENANFNLANFMRTHLYSSIATMKIGINILENENVKIDKIYGHGGFFKTEKVGQQVMADALNIPVCTLESASEGGAWGIAILASYLVNKAENESLDKYLDDKIFANQIQTEICPEENGIKGFDVFMERFIKGIEIEKSAINNF